MFGPRNALVQKNCWSKKISGQQKFGQKQFQVKKKFW